jgi:hypothetical protein
VIAPPPPALQRSAEVARMHDVGVVEPTQLLKYEPGQW